VDFNALEVAGPFAVIRNSFSICNFSQIKKQRNMLKNILSMFIEDERLMNQPSK